MEYLDEEEKITGEKNYSKAEIDKKTVEILEKMKNK